MYFADSIRSEVCVFHEYLAYNVFMSDTVKGEGITFLSCLPIRSNYGMKSFVQVISMLWKSFSIIPLVSLLPDAASLTSLQAEHISHTKACLCLYPRVTVECFSSAIARLFVSACLQLRP